MDITVNTYDCVAEVKVIAPVLYDIEPITDAFEKVLDHARKNKTRVFVTVDCTEFDGLGTMATGYFVKYLFSVRDKIGKYFECCAIIVEDTDGLIPMILSMYTPVRPLKLFTKDQDQDRIDWLSEKTH